MVPTHAKKKRGKARKARKRQGDSRFPGFSALLKRRKARRVRKLECHSKKSADSQDITPGFCGKRRDFVDQESQEWLCQCETVFAFLAFPHFPNMEKPGKPGMTVSV